MVIVAVFGPSPETPGLLLFWWCCLPLPPFDGALFPLLLLGGAGFSSLLLLCGVACILLLGVVLFR